MPEYSHRRTFAIISHPDAGKTTLTEKLLHAGGAIHTAGEVKARGDNRRARSDWMKIEQERGISVTSSVMTFIHNDITYNLLDTPGHEDFSEDTYRTLTAVDSAIMVIDVAKGIESQTLKLFEVCRLRDIPIMTFVNKTDREGQEIFDLMDEIQDKLALDIAPMVLPVGMGTDFNGLYDITKDQFLTSSEGNGGSYDETIDCSGLEDSQLDDRVPDFVLNPARENIELAQAGYCEFDKQAYRDGTLTPVIFGSALKNYGIKRIIEMIADNAPEPRPGKTDARIVEPSEENVSGFIFKVQANMDKNHRDRVAFMRMCSGSFKRGMKLKQTRTGKDIMVHSPIFFLAQDREIVEEAGPGDIIGIPNHGTIRVGDTFTQGEQMRFTGLPAFAPEILRRVRLGDTTKIKQLRSSLEDLAEEGLIQVFKPSLGSNWIVGVVGVLQLDVLKSRAKQEYRIDIDFEPVPYDTARWIRAEDPQKLKKFVEANRLNVVNDRDDNPVFMAKNTWEMNYVVEKNSDLEFLKTKELE